MRSCPTAVTVMDVFSIPPLAFTEGQWRAVRLCAPFEILFGAVPCLFWDLLINTGAFGIIAVKMLNNILLLSVLTVTSFPSKTDSRKTSKDICKNRCSCEEKENALNINCENKGFTTVSHFQPPQNKISQLFLNGNFLTKISQSEFLNYGNVTSLHLGNNGLQEIKMGAFNGLKNLKRLHLNNNNLEIIREDTFSGLESWSICKLIITTLVP